MPNKIVQARVKEELKKQADELFASIGMSTADAIRIFLQQSVNDSGMPFTPRIKTPNSKTLQAINDIENGKTRKAKSKKDFYKELGI
ncbi:MAG: hypothetical protein RLZZ210_73 [Pseudomonadota bacterium]|jgi:DNA-damage-inducible protein J